MATTKALTSWIFFFQNIRPLYLVQCLKTFLSVGIFFNYSNLSVDVDIPTSPELEQNRKEYKRAFLLESSYLSIYPLSIIYEGSRIL